MDWFETGWGLSLIVFLPLAGAGLVLVLPRKQELAAKSTALLFAFASFAASVYAAFTFDLGSSANFQFGTHLTWVPPPGGGGGLAPPPAPAPPPPPPSPLP